MKKTNIKIKNPCSLQWNSLKGDGTVRFCDSCSTNVVDLTKMSDSQIIDYVNKQRGRVCGRIKSTQIDGIIQKNSFNLKFLNSFLIFVLGLTPISTAEGLDFKKERLPVSSSENNVMITNTLKPNQITTSKSSIDSVVVFRGRIISTEDKSGIPGADVLVKGMKISTRSDVDGNFEIVISNEDLVVENITLIFSNIGYRVVELSLRAQSKDEICIEMKNDVMVLGEINVPRRWSPRGIWWKIKSIFRKK